MRDRPPGEGARGEGGRPGMFAGERGGRGEEGEAVGPGRAAGAQIELGGRPAREGWGGRPQPPPAPTTFQCFCGRAALLRFDRRGGGAPTFGLGKSVGESVWASVGDSLGASAGDSAEASVGESLGATVGYWTGASV